MSEKSDENSAENLLLQIYDDLAVASITSTDRGKFQSMIAAFFQTTERRWTLFEEHKRTLFEGA